jgi:hypothetical protein
MAPAAPRGEIEQVFARLNSLLASDGSRLVLLAAEGDSITARFDQGEDGACERCVIDKDAIEMLLREAVNNHLPQIKSVTLLKNDGRNN